MIGDIVRALQLGVPLLVAAFLVRYLWRAPRHSSLERVWLLYLNLALLTLMILAFLTGLLDGKWLVSPVRPYAQAIAYLVVAGVVVLEHVLLHRARQHNADQQRRKRRYIEQLSRERDGKPPAQ